MAMIGAPVTPDFGTIPTTVPTAGVQSLLAGLPTMAPRQHFLGQDGVGRAIAGNIGDFLLQLSHMQPIYAPARQRQDEIALMDKNYARSRADKTADDQTNYTQQLGLLDYKRLHPDDPLTQSLDQAGITDPAARQSYYQRNADRLTAPPMMSAQGVDEQGNPVMRFFPRAAPASPGAPTVGTVQGGYRFKGGNPADQSSWEAVGGPTGQPSGTFR